jgi:hypothetical protein
VLNWFFGTPTTAPGTFTLRYTFTVFALMIVLLLITTLFTTRGPPQPHQQGEPMNPTGPHHGMSGSPQPSATQLTAGTPKPTPIENPGTPKNATSAGE